MHWLGWGKGGAELGCFGDVVAYRAGTAACQVHVEDCAPVMVRVMATAVVGLRLSAKLLQEINEINARSRVVHLWWHDVDVGVECSLFAEAVNRESLMEACAHVASVANDLVVGMAAMFDGASGSVTGRHPLLEGG